MNARRFDRGSSAGLVGFDVNRRRVDDRLRTRPLIRRNGHDDDNSRKQAQAYENNDLACLHRVSPFFIFISN